MKETESARGSGVFPTEPRGVVMLIELIDEFFHMVKVSISEYFCIRCLVERWS